MGSVVFTFMLGHILLLVSVAFFASNGDIRCVTNPPDKEHPSQEPSLAQSSCGRYAAYSCCTAATVGHADLDNATDLENRWPVCGQISDGCLRFLQAESCFYFCDPYVEPWQRPNDMNGSFSGLPICASYCDDWFEACKDDFTCSSDWLKTVAVDYKYNCDGSETCQTFAQTYTNSRKLCETNWGPQFTYDEDNTNCMTMIFSGENPNANVKFERQDTGTTTAFSPTSSRGSATEEVTMAGLSAIILVVWSIYCSCS